MRFAALVIVTTLVVACGGPKQDGRAEPAAPAVVAPGSLVRDNGRERGVALERKGDLDGALQAYRVAYEAAPEADGAARDLARILARRGDLRSARSVLDAGLTRRPDDVDLLTFKAVMARLDGDTEGALLAAKAALARAPYEPGATLELARALTKQKKTALASAMLTRAAEGAPKDARLRFGLAEVARATGDDALALAELQAAATLDPNDAAVQAAIGGLALTHRDYGRAKEAYARAIALGDASSASSQGLQLAQAQMGKTQEKTR